MEQIKKIKDISLKIKEVLHIHDLEFCLEKFWNFAENECKEYISFLVKDKRDYQKIKLITKDIEQNNNNLRIKLAAEVDEYEVISSEFLNLIFQRKRGKEEQEDICNHTFILFLNVEDCEAIITRYYQTLEQNEIDLNTILIGKDNCQKKIKQSAHKLRLRSHSCYYKGDIELLKKKNNITSDIFGFYFNTDKKITYVLKDFLELDNFVDYYLPQKNLWSLNRQKENLMKPEKSVALQDPKVQNIISNLHKINDLKEYYYPHNLYYRILYYSTEKEEYMDCDFSINVDAHNQKCFRELLPLIEPIIEQIPNKTYNNCDIAYKVNYKDHADLSFYPGNKCNKCHKEITKNDNYCICYICKIEKKDYIICGNCYEGESQHNHPIIDVPVGGTIFLDKLTNFPSIQIDQEEEFGNLLYQSCARCGIEISKVVFTCCICEYIPFCSKCIKEFKNGENYDYYDECCEHHLFEHPMLISDHRWGIYQVIHGCSIPYCKKNPNFYWSYLYQPKL